MKVSALLAGAALVGALMVPGIASAANAYTTGNVNQRAGPSTNFPRVSTIPAGVAVTIFGCLRDLGWCDTSWQGQRGWVSGRYLERLYEGRRVVVADYGARIGVPIISFSFGNYWDRYYRDRSWYRDRPRWEERWARGDWDWREDRTRRRIVDEGDGFEAREFRRRTVQDDEVITGSTRRLTEEEARRLRRGSSDDVPRGIRKKGEDFCPPGLAKQGRCLVED